MGVTIAIPFYNSEEYLEDSIKSVFNQTFQDWELLLVDDGSTDSSLSIALSINDPRVRVLSDGCNMKLAARLNQIAREAKYDFVARMDADDLIPDYRIQKQYDYLMGHPEHDFVTTGVGSLEGDASVRGIRIPDPGKRVKNVDEVYAGHHQIVHASIMARKSWFLRNSYDESLVRCQDFELWLRAYINEDLNYGILPVNGYYYREDLNVTKNKLLAAYEVGNKVIDKHYNFLPNPNKKKLILEVKKIIAKLIFNFGAERFYMRNRNNKALDEHAVKEMLSQIENISKISLPLK